MKTEAGWRARLRYEFDKSMAGGAIALIGWLGLISLIVIVIAGLFLSLTGITQEGAEPVGFIEGAWESLMRTMDAGTMGGDMGWSFRAVSLVVTFCGIFVFSALIGVLSTGLENKLEELRKGRSKVLEQDHTVILNWSASIFDVISELVIANQSRRRPRIVIMANKDKVEMEEEIATKVADLKNTRIICRSGDPTDLYDLSIVNPQTSRSMILLSPDSADPDSEVIKSVLALVHDPKRRKAPYMIAAEIRDGRNAEVARIVGGHELQMVLADDLISRIIVHTSRQSGLSAVYSELLDFDGCEIYTQELPALAGKSFAAAAMSFENCTLIGICDKTDRVNLNPPGNRVIEAGEKAIIIAEDDASIGTWPGEIRVAKEALRPPVKRPVQAERTLMLGWNRRGPIVARELSRYMEPGSILTIAADTLGFVQDISNLALMGDNMAVEHHVIDTGSRSALDRLDVTGYDHVLVLGYSDDMPVQSADTRTLITLLHLRQIADGAKADINVVSEMTDVRNRELAEVTRADDFVVSNKLVSLMLAQASENAYMAAIFSELLDEDGSEIYMRPITEYVSVDQPVNFFTIAFSALRRGEVAIGYRRIRPDADDPRNLDGVVVNPSRANPVEFRPGDMVIVLARD